MDGRNVDQAHWWWSCSWNKGHFECVEKMFQNITFGKQIFVLNADFCVDWLSIICWNSTDCCMFMIRAFVSWLLNRANYPCKWQLHLLIAYPPNAETSTDYCVSMMSICVVALNRVDYPCKFLLNSLISYPSYIENSTDYRVFLLSICVVFLYRCKIWKDLEHLSRMMLLLTTSSYWSTRPWNWILEKLKLLMSYLAEIEKDGTKSSTLVQPS